MAFGLGIAAKIATAILPDAIGGFFKTKQSKQNLEYAHKNAILEERKGSWKDEFVVLVFLIHYPTFFIGFLLDPIIFWMLGVNWFGPAADQYVDLLIDTLGVEGYRVAVAGCFTLAGVKVGVNAVGDKVALHKNNQVRAANESKKIDADKKAKKKERFPKPDAWRDRR